MTLYAPLIEVTFEDGPPDRGVGGRPGAPCPNPLIPPSPPPRPAPDGRASCAPRAPSRRAIGPADRRAYRGVHRGTTPRPAHHVPLGASDARWCLTPARTGPRHSAMRRHGMRDMACSASVLLLGLTRASARASDRAHRAGVGDGSGRGARDGSRGPDRALAFRLLLPETGGRAARRSPSASSGLTCGPGRSRRGFALASRSRPRRERPARGRPRRGRGPHCARSEPA